MLEQSHLFHFDGYVVDPASRSLNREGRPVALNSKTFELLLYLVRHPHQVVTKEELFRSVWPDSFVEEGNLSQHIFLLRKAFALSNNGGSPDGGKNARILVTIPGRGYQFTAAVQRIPRRIPTQIPAGHLAPLVQIHSVQSVTRLVIDEETDDNAPAQSEALPSPLRRQTRWVLPAAVVTVVLAAAGSFQLWRQMHRGPTQHIDLVLADMSNTTGDPDFDRALSQALMIDLEQSPFLNFLPPAAIRETLVQMQHDQLNQNDSLTPALAQEVCERNDAQAVLDGSISRFGDKYLLLFNVTSCVSGKMIAVDKREISSKSEVLAALDLAATRLRKQLGESAASIDRFRIPVASATTSSLEALRAYSQALESGDRGDTVSEQMLFQHAIALDPNFASAYKDLSASFYNRGDFVQAASTIRKAYDLRSRTTERERLAIEIAYNTYGTGDLEATIASLRLYDRIYPDNPAIWYSLAQMYSGLGEHPQAVEAGERAYRLAPNSGFGADTLARVYRRANRFADAKRIAQTAIAEGKDRWGIHSTLFQVAFAEHDQAAMQAEANWGFTHQQLGQSLTNLGFVAASEGKRREAVADFTRAREEAVRSGDSDFADLASLDLAGVLLELDDPTGAAASLKEMKTDAGDPGTIALFQASLGNPIPAQQLVSKIVASNSRSSLNLYFDLPEARSALSLLAHKPAEAAEAIEPARKYQMRDYGAPYQRAEAEAQAGMLDLAAADYRLILANPGIDPIWPDYTLSHLRLARVLVRQSKFADARAEYQAFLTSWNDADSGLPIFEAAKRELAASRF